MNLTPEQRAALPTDVFRVENPPTIKDYAAGEHLRTLLSKAIAELVDIVETPVIVSYAVSRFNDCGDYPWLAVRCGDVFTEVHDTDFQYLRNYAIKRGKNIDIIVGVLENLSTENWLSYFLTAFDIRYVDQTLSLVVENGVPWLIFGNTNAGDCGRVFSLFDDMFLTYYGETPIRFDRIIEGDWSDLGFLSNFVWDFKQNRPGEYEKNKTIIDYKIKKYFEEICSNRTYVMLIPDF